MKINGKVIKYINPFLACWLIMSLEETLFSIFDIFPCFLDNLSAVDKLSADISVACWGLVTIKMHSNMESILSIWDGFL